MKAIAHVLLAAIVSSGLLALPLHAEEQVQRYIVVLKQRSGAVPDVASLGGKSSSGRTTNSSSPFRPERWPL